MDPIFHLINTCALYILTFIYSILMMLPWAPIKNNAGCLWRLPLRVLVDLSVTFWIYFLKKATNWFSNSCLCFLSLNLFFCLFYGSFFFVCLVFYCRSQPFLTLFCAFFKSLDSKVDAIPDARKIITSSCLSLSKSFLNHPHSFSPCSTLSLSLSLVLEDKIKYFRIMATSRWNSGSPAISKVKQYLDWYVT